MTRAVLWSSSAGDITANLAFTNNFAATADPTVNDDISKGYTAGSVWINPTTGRGFVCYSNVKGAAVWTIDAQAGGLTQQAAPVAKTVSGVLAAADIVAGIITVNQGGAAASNQQLPLASAMDTAFPQAVVGSAVDFKVINISTVAAEIANITTNTGWTLVGSMAMGAIAATSWSSGNFRARKTGTAAWSLYRIG